MPQIVRLISQNKEGSNFNIRSKTQQKFYTCSEQTPKQPSGQHRRSNRKSDPQTNMSCNITPHPDKHFAFLPGRDTIPQMLQLM
jgi:hypothetical protein